MYNNNKKRLRPNRNGYAATTTTQKMALLAVFAMSILSASDAFSKVAPKKRSSVLAFRNLGGSDHHHDLASLSRNIVSAPWVASSISSMMVEGSTAIKVQSPGATAAAASSATTTTTGTRTDDQNHLPTWLAVPRSHLSETNLQRLRLAMSDSYFTENEALKVMYAIEEAAAGDAQLVAGASEFLLLVLETVDMGVDALLAAAFHYCSSATARRQAADRLTHHPNTASFGASVETLVLDVGRLKELELLAARVMQQHSEAARPDQNDADNLRKLLLSETADWRALAIRTVASLYRLRGILSASENPNRVQLTAEAVRTAREALTIYAPLASRLGMNRLKNEVESAAFKILYQRQHGKVNALVQQVRRPFAGVTIGESMDQLMKQVQDEMTDMFHNDPQFQTHVESFSVTARVKQPYSLWKKMLRNGYDHILQVPDAVALRIVLKAKIVEGEPTAVLRARERALCYYAQNKCTERWQPLADNPRFKDYIERPKANGYQSLHYTAMAEFAGENWTMEIQVRSSEMHSVAEYGLASHWDYKVQKKEKAAALVSPPSPLTASLKVKIEDEDMDRSSQAYLRKVQQWHWQTVGAQPEPSFLVEKRDNDSNILRPSRINRESSEQLEPYIRAMTMARSDLARDFVFVFLKQKTSEARVLALPSGSCVVDALREGEKSLGISLWESSFDVNGDSAATVTRRLSNGDVLTTV